MKTKLSFLRSCFLIFAVGFALVCHSEVAPKRYTVSGYFSDASTGEHLLGVNIYDRISGLGASANEYGFYSLTLPAGQCELRVTFVGYATEAMAFELKSDTVLNMRLSTEAVEFKEVVISAKQNKVEQSQMSMIDVPVQKMEKIPVILGEPDVLKVIQLLPGVQSGSEGTSGIYVRGGGADQNLFLLDGVPVYNASHMFGFFSVFNPGSVKSVKLYKGGFPAHYGGRLSSVVDIRMKEGNDQEFSGDVSVGLISSRMNIEGPIVKGKSSFLVSARRTYIDLLAQPFITLYNKSQDLDQVSGGYFFYDMNAKINHKFSDRSRLYLSTYLGRDKVYSKATYTYSNSTYHSNSDGTYQEVITDKYEDRADLDLNWGNRIAALRWNYQFNNKLFSNTTVTYSKYNFNTNMSYGEYNLTKNTESSSAFDYFSSIQDYTAKVDFDYLPHPNHAMKAGTGFTAHYFKPGVQVLKMSSSESPDDNYDKRTPKNDVTAYEHYAYVEDNITIGQRFKANIGLHYSGVSVQNKMYTSLQPRASARFKLMEDCSLKLSYAKMNQFVHLLSSSAIDMPTDLWVPVTSKLTPPVSHQYAVGTSINLPWSLDLTIEGFYKTMDNLIAYKDGASFSGTANTNWDEMVELGRGWAYGAEFLLEKTVGKTTGWLGYTWAKSDRQYENINHGNIFPAHYDRRHDFSLVLTHAFSDRFDMGFTWVFNTGNAVTLGAYQYPRFKDDGASDSYWSVNVKDYGGRNSYRMPSYHRLDLGFNFHKQLERGSRTWNISFYNAYNRQNPFMLMWEEDYDNPINVPVYDESGNLMYTNTEYAKVLKQLSIFPIIPSVSYTYKF